MFTNLKQKIQQTWNKKVGLLHLTSHLNSFFRRPKPKIDESSNSTDDHNRTVNQLVFWATKKRPGADIPKKQKHISSSGGERVGEHGPPFPSSLGCQLLLEVVFCLRWTFWRSGRFAIRIFIYVYCRSYILKPYNKIILEMEIDDTQSSWGCDNVDIGIQWHASWSTELKCLQGGPSTSYKWSYGAPINGLIDWFSWGEITLLIGVRG